MSGSAGPGPLLRAGFRPIHVDGKLHWKEEKEPLDYMRGLALDLTTGRIVDLCGVADFTVVDAELSVYGKKTL